MQGRKNETSSMSHEGALREEMSNSREDSGENSEEKGFLWSLLAGGACFWENSREKVAFVKCHCSVMPLHAQDYFQGQMA